MKRSSGPHTRALVEATQGQGEAGGKGKKHDKELPGKGHPAFPTPVRGDHIFFPGFSPSQKTLPFRWGVL